MKKCLSLLIALSLVLSMCVLPVSAAADVDSYIFNETFEDYTADVNWVTGADANGYVTAEGVQANAWTVAGDTSGASVKVVDGAAATGDADFTGGKVLEVNAGTSTSWFAIKKNALNADGTYKVNRQVGKNLVYEAMIFIPSTFESAQSELSFLDMQRNDKPTNFKGSSYVFSHISSTQWIARSSGQYNSNYFGRYTLSGVTAAADRSIEKYKGRWTHARFVVDSAEDVSAKDESDTSRFYMEDALFTALYTHDPKDATGTKGKNPAFPYEIGDKLVDFHAGDMNTNEATIVNAFPYKGTVFTVYNPSGKTDVSKYYIDDLKAYFVDQFAMGTPVNTENYSKGTKIEVPFNTEVKDSFVEMHSITNSKIEKHNRVLANDLIKLTDAYGAEIENGIASATLSADNKTVEIVLSDAIESETDYKLQFAVEFRDVYGQGLNDHGRVETIDVHTAEALDVVEAPEAINNLIPSDPRTFDIKYSGAVASVTATLAGNDVKVQLLDENKTARISFTEVVAGDLVVTARGTVGQVSVVTIPVTVAAGIKGATIMDDDLNGYELGSIITNSKASVASAGGAKQRTTYSGTNGKFTYTKWHTNSYYDTASTQAKKYDVIPFDDDANTAKIEIVDNPNGVAGDKALKVSLSEIHTSLTVQRAYDVAPQRGGVLVYEAKYWFPDNTYTGLESGYGTLMFNGGVGYQRAGGFGNLYIAQGQWNAYPGVGNVAGKYSRASSTTNMERGKWVTITNVVDWTADATATRPDTIRAYIDGVPVGARLWETSKLQIGDPIYDLYPEDYYGEYPVTGEIAYNNKSNIGTVAYPFYNIKNVINGGDTTENQDIYYYIDDYKAYLADDFTAEVVGDTETYTPNQVVKILFNSQIPENQLAELYVVDKATGAKVEDATFTLANGGYAVDVQLPAAVAKGEVYTVVAPTTFHDVTFQPLKNNADWTFDITIGEYVAFKGEVDVTEINGFVSGRTAKATLTLSKAVNTTDGIVVKNKDEVAVTEGWNASLSSDGKTIVLDFTNLADADYTVDFAGLTAADGDKIVNADEIAITIKAKVSKIMIFEENFETGYTVGEDWLENAPTNGKWDFSTGGAIDDDFLGVVDASEVGTPTGKAKFEGNVLKIYAKGNSPSAARQFVARAKSQIGAIDIEKDYPNKVIVYEADVYAKEANDGVRTLNPSFYDAAGSFSQHAKWTSVTSWKIEGASAYMDWGKLDSAGYIHGAKAQYGVTGSCTGLSTSQRAIHAMVVVDQRNEIDTTKLFANDIQFTAQDNTLLLDHVEFGKTNYEFPMNSYTKSDVAEDVGDFRGILFHGYVPKNKATNADFYVDNIKAYLVDAFEIESIEGASTAFNAAKDTVKFNFTNKVASLEDVAANIKLVDAEGKAVENAVAFSLAEGGYQVVAKLNESVIGGNAEYKFVVSPLLKDEFGVSLASDYYFYDYKPANATQTAYMLWKGNSYSNIKFFWSEAEAEEFKAANSAWASATLLSYSWTTDANGKVGKFHPYGLSNTGTDFNASCWTIDEEAMKLETIIKTTKATSLYAEATAAVIDGTNVSTTLAFTNPEEDTLDVWYIVAAYGDYNEMIGCQAAAFKAEKGTMDPITVNFTTKSANIKSVKVYVWDGYKTMVPYQDAEEIMQ